MRISRRVKPQAVVNDSSVWSRQHVSLPANGAAVLPCAEPYCAAIFIASPLQFNTVPFPKLLDVAVNLVLRK